MLKTISRLKEEENNEEIKCDICKKIPKLSHGKYCNGCQEMFIN